MTALASPGMYNLLVFSALRIEPVPRSAPKLCVCGLSRRWIRRAGTHTMTTTRLHNTLPHFSKLFSAALALVLGVAPVMAQFGRPPQKPSGPWMDKALSPDQRADLVVKALTLDEKIALLHANGWEELMGGPDKLPPRALGNAGFIPGIPRLGIPDLQMADATVGVSHSSVFGRYS